MNRDFKLGDKVIVVKPEKKSHAGVRGIVMYADTYGVAIKITYVPPLSNLKNRKWVYLYRYKLKRIREAKVYRRKE